MRTGHQQRRRNGEVVETQDYYVGQAYNGHIQVYDKKTGGMVMHISCTAMCTKERLQAFADRLQSGGPSIEAVRAL